MPELPEVETVRRGLEESIVGCRIRQATVMRADLRYPFPPNLSDMLRGHPVHAVERRAKYLLFTIGDAYFVGHLGMSGSFTVRRSGEISQQKHEHMCWLLEDGREVIYHDPRRFGFFIEVESFGHHPYLTSLGVEPLSPFFTPALLEATMQGKHAPIKQFLMDQRIVVGIGNIYASEILFRCHLHPTTLTHMCLPHVENIVICTRQVLEEALESGGSTLRNYADASGNTGYFQHHFHVYGREGEPCSICATPITRIVQAGRSTFFCALCQPRITP
jgi:formamidopyrimidine-DNA glycosylase